jgi:hypothetical protein
MNEKEYMTMKRVLVSLAMMATIAIPAMAGRVQITDENTSDVVGVTDLALDVMLSDPTTPPLIVYLNEVDCVTSIVSNFNIDEYDIEVADATGFDVGDYIGVFNTNAARFYAANVLAIDGTTITLDTPSDFDFLVGDRVQCGSKEMNVDGSGTNRIFSIRADPSIDITIDVTRVIIHIIGTSTMDDAKFGDIDALLRGVVLRRIDGITQNIFNAKTNGEFGEIAFDKEYDTKAPAGFTGFSCRLTFAGQNKMGVAIRLGPDDDLQLIVQDDLSDLISFRVVAEGHLVSF